MNDTARKFISRPFQNTFTFQNRTGGSYFVSPTKMWRRVHCRRFYSRGVRTYVLATAINDRLQHRSAVFRRPSIGLEVCKRSSLNVHIDSILSVEFIPGIHEDFKCGDSLILIHSLLHGSYKRYILNNLFFEQLECFKRLRGCHQWILRTKLSLYEHSWHFLLHTSSQFDGCRKTIISFVESVVYSRCKYVHKQSSNRNNDIWTSTPHL